jgi:aconitate hydratase 2 / 2-methylisocitrate dehydratase
MLEAYRQHVAERAALGIPPLPLSAKQTEQLVELFKNPPAGEADFLVNLITHRVPAGVDNAAKVKASYLAAVAHGTEKTPLLSRETATQLLGTMLGGYNISPMVDLLDDALVGGIAADGLKKTLLMFDQFHDVKEKADKGNAHAKGVMQSWADAEWFTSRPEVPKSIKISVFKVTGETNTDDLSPAPDAWSRPDIPLHALAMLKNKRDGITPEEDGKRGPVKFINDLRAKGNLVAYVGDVVGTGSSRKSATNSVLWYTGDDIPFIPNKRFGGVCLGSKIAPIFYNTMEDAGALPIEIDVTQMNMGERWQNHRRNAAQKSRVARRSSGRWSHSVDRGSWTDRQGARSVGPASEHVIPLTCGTKRLGQRLHACTKDGRSCVRPPRGQRRSPRHLLRTEDDQRRLTRHHRSNDP